MLRDQMIQVYWLAAVGLVGCAAPTSGASDETNRAGSSSGGATSTQPDSATGGVSPSSPVGAGGSSTGGATGADNPTTGGATASGGSPNAPTSTGGSSGNSGSATWASFDASLDGFAITWVETADESNAFSFDGSTGNPGGSAKLEAKIAEADEKVFVSGYPASSLNLSGKTITASIKLDSGLSSDDGCPGGAYVFAKSGDDYDFARGTWTNLSISDGWVTLSMALNSPDYDEGLDSSDVREIGVAVSAGGPCATSSNPYGMAVVHIDSIAF